MTQKLTQTFFIILLVLLAILALSALTTHYSNLPERVSQHETLAFGSSRLVPGSQAAMRVVVRDSKDASPLPDADITVSMQPATGGKTVALYQGRTDSQGTADVSFLVPSGAAVEQTLRIETRSSLGSDEIERPVLLQRDYRVLLTSDKPLYQPGQVIHLRALALSSFDLTPASGADLELVIADGKGNKVFRQTLTTSEYGVAFTDFRLAGQVNTGAYKINATLKPEGQPPVSSEKTVTVEHYVLPKFKVQLDTAKPYYRPGDHVAAGIEAAYFFGKPVAGGQVEVTGFTFDFERTDVFTIQGQTGADGRFEFEFDLPGYIAGSDLEGGLGRFYLQASVTDLAEQTESSQLSLAVSNSGLVVEAIPEGGQFRPGVENILYVLTSYPDGSPAETDLDVSLNYSNEHVQARTGPYGVAEVRFTPQDVWQNIAVEARDVQGNRAYQEFYFEGEYMEEGVLLRPDRPVYRVGETMGLTVLTSQSSGTIYLDIIREGQTVSTRAVPVEDGRAELSVDLTPDLHGTLELHAYKILSSGSIARDTRMVVVDAADDLQIRLTPGQDPYRPGEDATLDVQVSSLDGSGVQSALGIAVVDEAVFALAESDPGFAKLYFMLEQEILQPRYDLHGFSVPDLLGEPLPVDVELQSAVEDAAQASLAAAAPRAAFGLQANSHQEAIQGLEDERGDFFTSLSEILYGAILVLPLLTLLLSVAALWRQKRLGSSLALILAFLVLAAFLILLWPLGEAASWVATPLDRLGYILEHLLFNQDAVPVILILAGLGSIMVLAAAAWQEEDAALGWALGLTILLFVVVAYLIKASSYSRFSPDDPLLAAGLIPLLGLPLAYLLRAGGFAGQRRYGLALAAALVALALPVGVIGAAATVGSGSFAASAPLMRAAGQPEMMVMEEAPMEMPAAAPAGAVEEPAMANAADGKEQDQSAVEAPRLRQFFPETMLWLPAEITQPDGSLQLQFPVADSITTWRVTALASSQDGRLGSASGRLRVFQDFFIDLDLPLALTVGDEVAVPVAVYNYLPDSQTVRLELSQEGWFELLDEPVKEIEIGAEDITVVYFRIRAAQFGQQPFQVTAIGSQMSDAIRKDVRVYPNGKEIRFSTSDRLEPGTPISEAVNIPAEAIPGTQSLVVKVYPGVLSQVVEGLESILRMPNGCFEQTSSTTYPNVLALDYLQTTNQLAPEVQMQAEEYINLGYQRLTTFEVQSSGGFSLFGDVPADRMLTAYGLQEFADMSRVHPVDPALIQRAAEWLLSQQAGDGSWENDRGLVHESTWSSLGNDRLPVTAYIAWSLVEAGYGNDPRTQKGLQYVRENAAQAEDAYVLALVANALSAADLESGNMNPATMAVLDRLAGMAQADGSVSYWTSGVATFMGSEGRSGSIETTALAALALLRADAHPELANGALTFLVQQKDDFGTWYTTQATVLALKSLLASARSGAENVNANVTISLNGGQTQTVRVTPENFDVVQMVTFDDLNIGRENVIGVIVEGEGSLMYQAAGSYYLPWEAVPQYPELAGGDELVTIDLQYDRSELAVDDTVRVDVTVTLNEPGGQAESALIDLGIPPGFTVQTEDLAALVASYDDTPDDYAFATIERYELTGRQILVYVSNLTSGQPLQFSYHLRAKFPLRVQTPASSAYDYYNPDVNGLTGPQVLTVSQ